jgi:hypothetical protein
VVRTGTPPPRLRSQLRGFDACRWPAPDGRHRGGTGLLVKESFQRRVDQPGNRVQAWRHTRGQSVTLDQLGSERAGGAPPGPRTSLPAPATRRAGGIPPGTGPLPIPTGAASRAGNCPLRGRQRAPPPWSGWTSRTRGDGEPPEQRDPILGDAGHGAVGTGNPGDQPPMTEWAIDLQGRSGSASSRTF